MLLALMGTGFTGTGTASDSAEDPDAAPSSRPAAGPESKALAGGQRPESGKNPQAGTPFKQDASKVWQVDNLTPTLKNSATDPDGDPVTITFEVWTLDAAGKPKAKVNVNDSNQYGVIVSKPVPSGKTAEVQVPWGKLDAGTK